LNFCKIILFLSLLIVCNNCDKIDDPDKIKLDYQYQGNFSIVAGSSYITLEEMSVNLDPNWQIFPDSLLRLVDTIEFSDTIPFNLSEIVGNKDYVKTISFLGNAKNEFPTNDIIIFSYANKYGIPISTLNSYELTIDSATFTNDTTFKSLGNAAIHIPFEPEIFNNWDTIENILISGYIVNNITRFSQFNYYERYKIYINLVVQVEFDFNLNELPKKK
jgi:hypothetical protein